MEIDFTPDTAPYIQERVWHPSQSVASLADGSVRLSLDVCTDAALRSWILGFGPAARVQAPEHLVSAIADAMLEARGRYETSGITSQDQR